MLILVLFFISNKIIKQIEAAMYKLSLRVYQKGQSESSAPKLTWKWLMIIKKKPSRVRLRGTQSVVEFDVCRCGGRPS